MPGPRIRPDRNCSTTWGTPSSDRRSTTRRSRRSTRRSARATRGLQGSAWYNLGNALFGTGKYKDAAEAYVQTLRINPADREAKQNLELALRKLQQQQKQPASGGGQNDQQQKDDKSPQKDPSAGNNANKQPDKQDKQEGPGPRPEQEEPGTTGQSRRRPSPRGARGD